jgi:hypothetical protein
VGVPGASRRIRAIRNSDAVHSLLHLARAMFKEAITLESLPALCGG